MRQSTWGCPQNRDRPAVSGVDYGGVTTNTVLKCFRSPLAGPLSMMCAPFESNLRHWLEVSVRRQGAHKFSVNPTVCVAKF